MAASDDAFSGRPAYLTRLNVNTNSQSITGNYSMIGWSIEVIRGSGASDAWAGDPSRWFATIAGASFSGTWSYNFNGTGTNYSIVIAAGELKVPHQTDGKISLLAQIDVIDDHGYLGESFNQLTMSPPDIPRTSKATLSSSNQPAGTGQITINTNRASTAFTHTITYTFGNESGTIANNVGTSYPWDLPYSLLNAIPTATSGTGVITTKTYNGATYIGSVTNTFTATAPNNSTVNPYFSTINPSEAVAGIAANVGTGKYVQGISKLNLSISGLQLKYGASIKTYKYTIDGNTVTTASGTTGVLPTAGTRTITATVTDSRGRSYTDTTTVSVAAWKSPVVASYSAVRALSTGVADDNGTYLSVKFTGSVSSILNGTERNSITYQIWTRLRGTTSWGTSKDGPTTLTNPAVTTGALTRLITGPYAITSAYEVLVRVTDDFDSTDVVISVPTSKIFMHWDDDKGIGINKYRTGAYVLDVGGTANIDSTLNVNSSITATGNLTVGGTLNGSGKIYTSSGADASLTTDGALQLGATNSTNTVFDNNEVQARNNGAASSWGVNQTGGNINLGSTASLVSVPGNFNAQKLPYAMQVGTVTTSASAVTNVSFTGGRFATTPRVFAQIYGGTSIVSITWVTNVDATGFEVRAFTLGGAQVAATVTWTALQFLSGTANG